MKALILSVVTGLCLVGCSDSSDQPAPNPTNAPASSGNPLAAPTDYLKSTVQAQQSAVKTVDITSLTKAIDLFNAQEGRLPRDLNELVAKKYISTLPTPPNGTKIVYDASAGTVQLVKLPGPL